VLHRRDCVLGVLIVVPVYNGQAQLDSLCRRLSEVLSPNDELLLVDDGSIDNSWGVIDRLSNASPAPGFGIKGIRLDKHRGQQAALMAALAVSTGQQVVTMDDDVSHPVEAIPALLTALNNGADLVYAHPPRHPGNSIRGQLSRLHQFHIRLITGAGTHVRVGSFRAMSNTLVSRVLRERFSFPYLSVQCLSLRPRPRVAMVETRSWQASGISRFKPGKLLALEFRLAAEYGVFSRIGKRYRASDSAQTVEWIAEKTWI
jgi:glycosyltransferase involved in cell wall biosynthesis